MNFSELNNGGDNCCIIRDAEKVECADVGDILLIKGTKYPRVSNALVHKSPDKRYDAGNVINRLILKVDVAALPPRPTAARHA